MLRDHEFFVCRHYPYLNAGHFCADSSGAGSISCLIELQTKPSAPIGHFSTCGCIVFPGQVRSLLDKRVGDAVTVVLASGLVRTAKSALSSSRIAFN